VVLLKLGDRSGPGHVLGEGARDDMWSADLPALAARAFRALDSDFAARARRHGGGLLVAGARFGAATHPSGGARAAMVLAELGIRALLARSWVAEWRRDVIHYGGLPLSFADDRDYLALGPGDELEVPALPEGLEPRRPLVVRNLTQGTQLAVRHDLGAREIAIVRSGGLLGAVALAGDAPARKEG
jgi:aconitate hydratase